MGTGFDIRTTHRTVQGTRNLRDLGGLPVAGGRIAPGRLYRAEIIALSGSGRRARVWDPAWRDEYAALGIRTVIDLRSARERSSIESGWPTATGGRAVTLDVGGGGEGEDTDYVRLILSHELERVDEAEMVRLMTRLVEGLRPRMPAIVRTVAEGAPVLLHCTAGKDRTGAVVAILLAALGADDDDLVADYAFTEELRGNRVRDFAAMLADAGVDPADVASLFGTPPAAMRGMLEHLRARYGGAVDYLRSCGVEDRDLSGLRAALVVEA